MKISNISQATEWPQQQNITHYISVNQIWQRVNPRGGKRNRPPRALGRRTMRYALIRDCTLQRAGTSSLKKPFLWGVPGPPNFRTPGDNHAASSTRTQLSIITFPNANFLNITMNFVNFDRFSRFCIAHPCATHKTDICSIRPQPYLRTSCR